MLNKSHEEWAFCLVLDLRGNAFGFSPMRMMLAVMMSYMAFIMLKYVPSIPSLWRVFIINGCWILSKAFSASIEMIMIFIHLLKWYIDIYIYFQIFKNPCIPGKMPIMVYNTQCIVWFYLLIFCQGYLHLYSLVILSYTFLFFFFV